MSLPTSYTQAYGSLGDFFARIRDAQAPEKFILQILKDWGFKSNSHRPFIPLLKALGFLGADGTPTARYNEYRDHSKSRAVLGKALKEAYSDVFLIKEQPTSADKALIEGKFKSYHNASDNVSKLHANTFFALLKLADIGNISDDSMQEEGEAQEPSVTKTSSEGGFSESKNLGGCLLYTSPSPRDLSTSRMPSSA